MGFETGVHLKVHKLPQMVDQGGSAGHGPCIVEATTCTPHRSHRPPIERVVLGKAILGC